MDVKGSITADEAGSFLGPCLHKPPLSETFLEVVRDANYPFVMAWLASFSHDPPTAVEVSVS